MVCISYFFFAYRRNTNTVTIWYFTTSCITYTKTPTNSEVKKTLLLPYVLLRSSKKKMLLFPYEYHFSWYRPSDPKPLFCIISDALIVPCHHPFRPFYEIIFCALPNGKMMTKKRGTSPKNKWLISLLGLSNKKSVFLPIKTFFESFPLLLCVHKILP